MARTHTLAAIAGGLLVVLTVGPVQAGGLAEAGRGTVKLGNQTYVTLERALEDARPGDTIRLSAGRHLGVPVTRKLDGLTIHGGNGVLDGALELHGDGIRLRNVAADHAQITIHGDRARVSRCAFLLDETRLRIVGDRARVDRSIFYGSVRGTSLVVEGARAKVTRNEFGFSVRPGDPALGTGMQIAGDRPLVRDNLFSGLSTSADISGTRARFERNEGVALFGGARVRGDGARVRKNAIRLAAADPLRMTPVTQPVQEIALEVIGDAVRVQRNLVAREYLTTDTVAAYFEAIVSQSGTVSVNLAIDAEELLRLSGSAVAVSGDDARVERNDLVGTSFGVSVAGDSANVSDNAFHWVDIAADVKGDHARVTDNQMSRALMGVHVRGDDFSVRDNDMDVGRMSAVGQGTVQIAVQHDAPDILIWNFEGDPVPLTGCPGVLAETDQGGGVVSDNVVVHELGGVGYELSVDDVTIARNVDVGAANATVSITLDGDDNVLRDNVVRDFGETGIELTGAGNLAADNRVGDGTGDAFVVEGSQNTLADNEASAAGGDGFCVLGGVGNVLTSCTALDCGEDGLENLATNTSVFGSTFRRNTRDVAGTGTFLEFSGNDFGSYLVE